MRDDVKVKVNVAVWHGGVRPRVVVDGCCVVSAAWLDDGAWTAGPPGFEVSFGKEGGEAAARDWLRRVGEACIEASKVEVPRE